MNVELQHRINLNRNLLGISNFRMHDSLPLEHARESLEEILSGVRQVVVIPYALGDLNSATSNIGNALIGMGVNTYLSPHEYPGAEERVIEDAEAIYISGGNTGTLVANLHASRNYEVGALVDSRPNAPQHSLVDVIRKKASEGTAIIGSSAGLNVMCADVRTTNDMQAAVQIKADGSKVLRIDGLGLLPPHLSVNPHFQDAVTITPEDRAIILALNPAYKTFTDHQGETRAQRIAQILEVDPDRVVLALREGASIVVKGSWVVVGGTTGGLIFKAGQDPQPVQNGDNLSHLLQE